MNNVTQQLTALAQGDPHAASRLLPLVYEELRKLAARRMAHDRLSGLRHRDRLQNLHCPPHWVHAVRHAILPSFAGRLAVK
jgi:hypothetical protein